MLKNRIFGYFSRSYLWFTLNELLVWVLRIY